MLFAVEEFDVEDGELVEVPAVGKGATVVLEEGDLLVNPRSNGDRVWVSLHRDGLDLSGPVGALPGPASMWACVMILPGHGFRCGRRLVAMIAGLSAVPASMVRVRQS